MSDTLDVQLLGRMRGEYESLSVSGAPMNTNTMAAADKRYIAVGTTPTVQYIVLSKSRVAGESQFLVPYRLIVKVVGKAGTGAPDYVAPPTPTVTPTASPSPTAVASATPSSGPIAQAGNGMSTGVVIGVAVAPSSSAHSVPSSCSPSPPPRVAGVSGPVSR